MSNFGYINGVKIVVTDHALARMVEMDISPEEAMLLITEPEDTYDSTKHPDSFWHRRGEHAVAIQKQGETLIVRTAVYSTMSGWLKANKDGRLSEDRELYMNKEIPPF